MVRKRPFFSMIVLEKEWSYVSVWDKINVIYDSVISSNSSDWWPTIVASLFAFFGICLQLFVANKSEKNNEEFIKKQAGIRNDFEKSESDKRIKFEERIEKSKIDADLIATARIRWIQEVRGLAVQIIQDFKKIANINLSIKDFSDKEISHLVKSIDEMDVKLYSLMMFFGADSNKNDIPTDRCTVLPPDREDNDGCNYIVNNNLKHIIDLNQRKKNLYIRTYDLKLDIKRNFYININSEAEVIQKEMPEAPLRFFVDSLLEESVEEFEKYSISAKQFIELKSKLKDLDELIIKLNEDVNKTQENFINLIRDYLKVEWKNVTRKQK